MTEIPSPAHRRTSAPSRRFRDEVKQCIGSDEGRYTTSVNYERRIRGDQKFSCAPRVSAESERRRGQSAVSSAKERLTLPQMNLMPLVISADACLLHMRCRVLPSALGWFGDSAVSEALGAS